LPGSSKLHLESFAVDQISIINATVQSVNGNYDGRSYGRRHAPTTGFDPEAH